MAGLLPVILRFVPLTFGMAVGSMIGALILAAILAVIRVLRIPVANQAAGVFISFFRGTPLLVQLFLFYYGLPQAIPAFVAIDGVSGAILGVARDQWEAARAVGMTEGQTMRRIILPQAARVFAPTMVNYFVDILKSTSLAFTLGVTEMMGAAQKEAAGSFRYLESFLVVAIIYWIMVEVLSRVQAWLERRTERRATGGTRA